MTDKTDDLREATRAANETLADLKAVAKEIKSLIAQMEVIKDDLTQVAVEVFDERMDQEVKAGLDRYRETLDKAIEDGTQAVYDRFDTIGAILLGKGQQSDIERLTLRAHESGDLPIKQGRG